MVDGFQIDVPGGVERGGRAGKPTPNTPFFKYIQFHTMSEDFESLLRTYREVYEAVVYFHRPNMTD